MSERRLTFAMRHRMATDLRKARPADWDEIERLLYIQASRKSNLYAQEIIRVAHALRTYSNTQSMSPETLATATHAELRNGKLNEQDQVRQSLERLDHMLADDAFAFDMSQYKSVAELCKQCGAPRQITFKQTRSADEGMTMIVLPCAKCQ